MLYDNHNHSQFSFDGKRTSVEKSSEEALRKGLSGLCFTDHCDFFVPAIREEAEPITCEVFDVDAQQKEIDRVQGLLGSRLRIFKGIEIGLEFRAREDIRKHLSSHRFDQVIASVHYLDDHDPWMGPEYFYKGKSYRQAYGRYLEVLYEEMRWLEDFDIMGHFDYITRYAPYPESSILYRDFPDIFDSIFRYT